MPATRIRLTTAIVCLAAYSATAIAYLVVGNFTSNIVENTLATRLDDAIPFVPAFVFGYMTLYVLPIVLIFAIRERKRLEETFVAYVVVNAVAFPIYVLYPVYCAKPAINTDTVSGWFLALEHSWDTPMNSFPSLHACFALLIFFSCRGLNARLSIVLFTTALLIGVSALLVKQHYVADIGAGFLLAYVAHRAAVAYTRRPTQEPVSRQQ